MVSVWVGNCDQGVIVLPFLFSTYSRLLIIFSIHCFQSLNSNNLVTRWVILIQSVRKVMGTAC